ncbi:hypothetical protein EZ428_01130 [Pedobacter frigiditerrae]|uniref:MG2 domain-containing protein n=1 Tax=Pedobacter frigiditerrae TaxID=2530452 RepID=A0A4R0N161_9SPHI|nr:hypothetical protein [Pedobacter frigiditerrae]TCC93405.1 hypothetical protein EZ428_01130 [Pedobacter frigiditerrae]
MKKLRLTLLFLTIIAPCLLFAQQANPLINKIEAYRRVFPTEKIYLSFDKPYYNVGDTLWFKSFLLNGDHQLNNFTDKIYVELFNDSLALVENRVIALNNGLGYGDFGLGNNLKEGTYTIRAYSNWQQNFGSEYFFEKSFYVGRADEKTWLLDSYQKLNASSDKKTLDLKIRITNIKNEAAGLKDVEVYLMNDKKRLMRADLQTNINGTIETQIPLGENKLTGNYSFLIIDKKEKSRQLALPIILQDAGQLDLQFMPEGGNMVNGIFARVAFKAIGADGLGKDIKGKIVNQNNEELVEFASIHKGMGSFYLLPQKGISYFAIYKLGGKEIRQQVPLAKDDGVSLRIDHLSKKDSLYVYLKASEGHRLDNYLLVAQSANEIIISAAINLKNGFSTLKLPKKDFPDGIIHFTVFSPVQNPIIERQVFVNHDQYISLAVKANQNSYGARDSVALELVATKEDRTPLSGSFSISVTDDSQVKQQDDENIVSYFLLKSNVKGNIEDAAWYFKDTEPATLLALDHLLLTQAWIGYNWDELTKQDLAPKYRAEKGNNITGQLTNLLNKPVPNINLTLMSMGKNIFVTDTISNQEGKFLFKNLPLLDSAAYTIKIKNAKGKTSLARIAVDEFKSAPDITSNNSVKPWFVNPDSTLLKYYTNKQLAKKPIDISALKPEGNLLKEVEIKGQAKREIFMQKSAWDANLKYKIDEEELKKNLRKSLLDLLKEKISGFTIGSFYADGAFGIKDHIVEGVKYPPPSRPRRHEFSNFMIGGYLISHVIIDGTNTHLVSTGTDDQIDNVPYQSNQYQVSRTALFPEVFVINIMIFNALGAEDIKNINVYRGISNYYLDITTRSGKGPWITNTKGVYVYRPKPLYLPKEFYSPKYTPQSLTPDYRSTIFWDANVVTDENGKARISFYTADKPSTYTVKIEGTDLMGRFGYQKSIIKIVNKTESK